MALSFKLAILLLLLLGFVSLRIRADSGINEQISTTENPDSFLRNELELLKSKISVIEPDIQAKTQELRSKYERILQLEKVIEEKSHSISSLQREIESLQKKGTIDAEERVGKAHARAGELEKQVEILKNKIELQNRNIDALELRENEAENKMMELNAKLENKKWVIDAEEQVGKAHARAGELEKQVQILKNKIVLQNMNRDALEFRANEAGNKMRELNVKLENEKLMEVQLEASAKAKDLMEVHGAWLPPWLVTHLVQVQSFVAANWNKHGKPTFDVAKQKAAEKSAEVQKWMEPHVETVKSSWIPILKEQWLTVTTSVGSYIQLATSRTFEVYEVSKSTVTPHIVRDAKKFTKPYINQAAAVTKPHVDRILVAAKPYTEPVIFAYGKFLKSASVYHHQSWIPILKEQWLTVTTSVGSYIQLATSRTVEVYEVSKSTVTPHIVRVRTIAEPYLQDAKKFTKPNINQAAAVTKPHVDRILVAAKPYTEPEIFAYGKFLKSASVYHHQVQASVHETLSKHELTSSLATKELVWFLITRKPTRNGATNHTNRRPKRRHTDK